MSQIWCNSPKLMTALLGMGREGMISVWSSIWSVPSAGCREMLHYMLVCCLWRACMHTHTDTPFARVISGSQCSCLCLGTEDFLFLLLLLDKYKPYCVKNLVSTSTSGPVGDPTSDVTAYQPLFISSSVLFQKKVGEPASNLENSRGHSVTFYKICFTAAVNGIGY